MTNLGINDTRPVALVRAAEPGPAVMARLSSLTEAAGILADLVATGTLEVRTMLWVGDSEPTYYAKVTPTYSATSRERAGATLDEALRAVHTATAHLRTEVA